MRIDVTTVENEFEDQTRAYAEFRLFSTLSRFGDVVQHAQVSLARPSDGQPSVECIVVVTLLGGTRTRICTRRHHAYDAINRAAARVNDVLRRHTGRAMSS